MKNSLYTGFTLIELMVVIAVLAIITAIAVPAYNNYIATARLAECSHGAQAIQVALEEFFLTNNRYFDGNGAAQLELNSDSMYTLPAAIVAGTANCDFNVTFGSTGNIATSYSISFVGANDLAGKSGEIVRN